MKLIYRKFIYQSLAALYTDVKAAYNNWWCCFDEIDEIGKENKVNSQLNFWGVGISEIEIEIFYENYHLADKNFQQTNSLVPKDDCALQYYDVDMTKVDFHGKKVYPKIHL